MVFAGLIVTLVGFGIAVASLGVSASTSMRLVMVLAGIGVSLAGILGVINTHYLKQAIWRR